MWCCLNNSFLSIVADRNDVSRLLVRARKHGHIEAVFPDANVFTDPTADYFYRAFISRESVSRALSDEVRNITYDNFKDSVADDGLHDCYLKFWAVMFALQQRAINAKDRV